MNFSNKDLRGHSFINEDLNGVDFSYSNLQGVSFKGASLEEANFNDADIRGTIFRDANLRRASFRKAKAGLQKRTICWHLTLAIFMSFLSSIMASFSVFLGIFLLSPGMIRLFTIIPGLIVFIFGGIVFVLVIHQGITDQSLGNIAGTGAVSVAGAGSISLAIGYISLSSPSNVTSAIIVLGFVSGKPLQRSSQLLLKQ